MANNENDAHEHKRGLFGWRKRTKAETTVEVPEPGPSTVDADRPANEPHPQTAPIGEPEGFIASADPVDPQSIDVPEAGADGGSAAGDQKSDVPSAAEAGLDAHGPQVSGAATQPGDRFVPPAMPERPVYDSGQAAADAARILRAARARRPAGAPDPLHEHHAGAADATGTVKPADVDAAKANISETSSATATPPAEPRRDDVTPVDAQKTESGDAAAGALASAVETPSTGEAAQASAPEPSANAASSAPSAGASAAAAAAPAPERPEDSANSERPANSESSEKSESSQEDAPAPVTEPNPVAPQEAAASALLAQQSDDAEKPPLDGAPRTTSTYDPDVDVDTHPSAQPLIATPISLDDAPAAAVAPAGEEPATTEPAAAARPVSQPAPLEAATAPLAPASARDASVAAAAAEVAEQPTAEIPEETVEATPRPGDRDDAPDAASTRQIAPSVTAAATQTPAEDDELEPSSAPLITERNVEVRHLQRSFGRKNRALTDVSFTARSGHVTALVGVNGAGKSTVLQILATLLKPQNGEVRINGIDAVARPQDARSSIGWVPDHIPLWPRMTVRHTLQTFARLYGLPRAEARKRTIDLMTKTGLNDVAKRQARQLSRGQRQLLSLARALVHDPQVLLLDEPTSGLDNISRDRVQAALRQLADEGKTVVISTNWFEGLDDYADHVVYLTEGVSASSAEVNQAATAPRAWRIRSLDPQALLEALQRFETPFDLDPVTQAVEVLMGSDEAANLLLARLVIAGVPVHDYSPAFSATEQTFRALQQQAPADTTESVLDALGAKTDDTADASVGGAADDSDGPAEASHERPRKGRGRGAGRTTDRSDRKGGDR
ncbi:ABC transporter ATP-binding protein [Pseudoclavibacter sp. CFCC 14310]|uniref:ABC transporter ATP-binding protein n=1 Tax=Pseudoclavibacter sp. CFCC 14310 TaxID=2615180 RepID=UPI00130144B9|nr:ABC transporter ATP-binding protein [Pseudoclavibacter sp. CFCC 14310]KAB1647379.1 ABC transporter ATP-binding protein [Pseudoclavibacter sp. CFCC 14310]